MSREATLFVEVHIESELSDVGLHVCVAVDGATFTRGVARHTDEPQSLDEGGHVNLALKLLEGDGHGVAG